MGNLSGEMNFSLEAIKRSSVMQQFAPNGLESHPLVQLDIFRFVDFTHAATGHEAKDAKSRGN
jgi:hypothetical protein